MADTETVTPAPETTTPDSEAPAAPTQPAVQRGIGHWFGLGAEVGVSLAAASFGTALLGPIGGMLFSGLTSAAFEYFRAKKEDGSTDWGRVGLAFAMGLLPGALGKGVSKIATKIFGGGLFNRLASGIGGVFVKETPRLAALAPGMFKGAMFGATYGYSKSLAMAKYDGATWAESHEIGMTGLYVGGGSGAFAGAFTGYTAAAGSAVRSHFAAHGTKYLIGAGATTLLTGGGYVISTVSAQNAYGQGLRDGKALATTTTTSPAPPLTSMASTGP